MTAVPYLVIVPDQDSAPSRNLVNGIEAMLIMATTSADAIALAQAQYEQDEDGLWSQATVTQVVADGTFHGWALNINIYNTDGSFYGGVTVNADGTDNTHATGVLTGSGEPSDGDTVTIGTRVYTFQTTLTAVDGHVHIGGSEANAFTNLTHAINNSGGTAGTDYFVTEADPNVTGVDVSSVVTVTAILGGSAPDSVATTRTGTSCAWGNATLTGGSADTYDTLGAAAVTALNAAGFGITHAAYNSSTNVLTVAGTADNIGDHELTVALVPANSVNSVPVRGAIGAIVDDGVSGAALTVAFGADNYVIPQPAAGLRAVALFGSGGSGAGCYVVSPGGADGALEGVTYWDGIDTAVVYAATAADATDIATSTYANTMVKLWEAATPLKAVAGTDLNGYTLFVSLTAPAAAAYNNGTTYTPGQEVTGTDGNTYQSIAGSTGIAPPNKLFWSLIVNAGLPAVQQFVVGGSGATFDTLGTAIASALNADPSALIANAAYNTSTNVLTCAGTADDLGAYNLVIGFYPPDATGSAVNAEQVAIPGFITAVVDNGSAGSAVTATFAADAYALPNVVAYLARS